MSDSEWRRNVSRSWLPDAVAICSFAWSMWKKLRANRWKAHWREFDDYGFYRRRIDDELSELDRAQRFEGSREVMGESADVGNFAMMIHDRARLGLLPTPEPPDEEELGAKESFFNDSTK